MSGCLDAVIFFVQNWLGPDYEIVKKIYMWNNKCSFYLKRRFPSHGNVKQNGIWIRRLGSHVIFEFLFRQFAMFLEFAMLNINHFIYLKQDTIFLTKVLLKMLSVILLVAKLLKN